MKYPFFKLYAPEGDAGSGGSGDAGAGAGANGGAGANQGQQGAGNAANGAAGTPQNFDIRQHLDDAGKFKPEWWKAAGIDENYGKKFTEPLAAFKSGYSAEKLVGAKGIIPPGPNATQADRDAFFKALGRPDKPEEYGFVKPEKIGDRAVPDHAWDPKRAANWQAKLFELGVPKDTAHKIVEAAITESLDGMAMMEQAGQMAQKQSADALRKEWGADYDTNLAIAQQAAAKVGGDELKNHPGLGNDPVMIKALAKMGKMLGEKPGVNLREGAGNGNQMSRAEANQAAMALTAKMAKLNAENRNWKNTPEAAQMKVEKTRLFQLAHPDS